MAGTISAPGRPARSSPGVDAGSECRVRSGPRDAAAGSARASVREVCLVGVAARSGSWAVGDRLPWSGRVYRVRSIQDAPAGCGYVHLGPGSSQGESSEARPARVGLG